MARPARLRRHAAGVELATRPRQGRRRTLAVQCADPGDRIISDVSSNSRVHPSGARLFRRGGLLFAAVAVTAVATAAASLWVSLAAIERDPNLLPPGDQSIASADTSINVLLISADAAKGADVADIATLLIAVAMRSSMRLNPFVLKRHPARIGAACWGAKVLVRVMIMSSPRHSVDLPVSYAGVLHALGRRAW